MNAAPKAAQFESAAPREMCLANAEIVLEDKVMRGAVHVVDGRIAGITQGDGVPVGALDLHGDTLVPGLVELHTDNLEHHMEPRPSVHLPCDSAILAHDGELASVGITTVFDALRVGALGQFGNQAKVYARGVASELLALREAGLLRIRHLIHLRAEICSETLIEEFAGFAASDHVGLVSLMDHTPGQRQFRDLDKLRVYYAGKFGYTEAEFQQIVALRQAQGKKVRDIHEAAALKAAARLGATLASHDDTTQEHVTKSRQMGIALAEFPTTLEAAQACRDQGIKIIMGAPNLVRGASHSGNVSALELAENGLVDIISSDYVPALLMVSAFRLAALWDDLPRAIRLVSATACDATGLSDRGRIAEGCLADFVQVQMHGRTPVIRAVWCGGARVG